MGISKSIKEGVQAFLVAGALSSCVGQIEDGKEAQKDIQTETIAEKTKSLVNFCIMSASDVDGVICEIKSQGTPVASLDVDCWDVKTTGTIPMSKQMTKELDNTDKIDIKKDCKIKAGQW